MGAGKTTIGSYLASKLEVRYVRLGELQPSARNARQHSRIKIRQLANTIRTLRVLSAILVDESLENFAVRMRHNCYTQR